MALLPGISPWQIEWNDYTAQEVVHAEFLVRADLYGIPAVFLCYILIGSCVTNIRRGAAVAAAQNDESWKSMFDVSRQMIWLLQVALAALAVYVLALHCLAMPTPTVSQNAFLAQSRVGRWIYLTRQCLTFQAMHQSLSLFSRSSPILAALTHGIAVLVAALGFFVTMQYFLLIVPSEGYKAECQLWRDKGVQFEEVAAFLHIPAGVIAAADLLFVRNPEMMSASFSLRATLPFTVLYVFAYLGLLVGNFQLTGHWPYAMLEEYGTDFFKWAGFAGKQIVVISALVVVGWVFTLLRRPTQSLSDPGTKRD